MKIKNNGNMDRPIDDVIFKYIFGAEQSKPILLSFINAVLEDSDLPKMKSVTIKNPFSLQSFAEDKLSIVDIKAEDNLGRLYDIEVQTVNEKDFKNRSLYYWAKMYSEHLKESEEYGILKPAICINILDYAIFKEVEEAHTLFVLRENRMPELVLTDHLEIHYLELEKIPLSPGRTKLDWWLGFLKYGGEEMKTLLSDDDINVAQRRFKDFQRDEELRHRQLARHMGQLDYNSNMARAREKGLEEGRTEGLEKGRAEGIAKGIAEGKAEGVREALLLAAKNLLQSGASAELIRSATGLTEEEILMLKSGNQP